MSEPVIQFRPAARKDAALILAFIRELADYEKLSHEVTADEEIIAQSLFGERPRAEAILAEIDGQAAGFALFFHNFSTFLGRPGLYVEDIFVRPAFRKLGLGRRFFIELARIAEERDCGRMEWACLDWNEPALGFYGKLGAQPMDEWTVLRLTRNQITALAQDGQATREEQAA